MSLKSDPPTRQEKEEQLRRILESETFKPRWALRKLLERVVVDCLDGKIGRDYERTLAIDVFGKEQDWTPLDGAVVRQSMTNLRKQLLKFYESEGYGDNVHIRFSKQSGFLAHFEYRWMTGPKETVQRLADAFSYAFPDLQRCNRIVRELEKCVAEHPSYAPAYLVLAESILAGISCGDYLDDTEDSSEPWAFAMPTALARAETAVKLGTRLDAQLPGLHVMAGAIHCCRFAWRDADAAFQMARRLAPDQMRSSFWYMVFLLAVGSPDDIKSISFVGRKSPGRLLRYVGPFLHYAIYRDFRAAFDEMLKRSDSHFAHSEPAKVGREPARLDDWPAEILMACICLSLGYYAGIRYATEGVHRSQVDAFLGVELLAWKQLQRRSSGPDPMPQLYNRFDKSETQGPVSCAMAYVAAGKTGQAIKQLELACELGHPAMIWLHRWPVFDSLREDDRFKALVKRMNLPNS